jgi:hypothetical protein
MPGASLRPDRLRTQLRAAPQAADPRPIRSRRQDMAEFSTHCLFGIYPYIALVVLAVGSVIRYDREPYTWRSGSSQLLRRKQLIWGSVLFHLGVLFIFAGHLVGLLTPIAIFDTLGISHGAKQTLAVVAGGIAGAMAIIGATLLVHRRLLRCPGAGIIEHHRHADHHPALDAALRSGSDHPTSLLTSTARRW